MNAPSSLADSCPRCIPGDNPAAIPLTVSRNGASLTAAYRCTCGCEWRTCWDAGAAGWPLSRTTGPVPLGDALKALPKTAA